MCICDTGVDGTFAGGVAVLLLGATGDGIWGSMIGCGLGCLGGLGGDVLCGRGVL